MQIDKSKLSPEAQEYIKDDVSKLIPLIEVGVKVMTHIQTDQDVQYVKTEFEKLSLTFDKKSADLLKSFEKTMTEQLGRNFDPAIADSYLGKTVNFLREQMKDVKDEIDKRMKDVAETYEKLSKATDLDNETSPIGKLKGLVKDVQQFVETQFDTENRSSFASKVTHAAFILFRYCFASSLTRFS